MGKTNVIYLKDYQPPAYLIESTDLNIDLYEDKTLVQATLKMKINKNTSFEKAPPLILQGEKLLLQSLELNGRTLSVQDYQVNANTLTIYSVPDTFVLVIRTEIHPELNTELSGLFRSKNLFCTQCEAEGFRRITYYLDRPDVMAKFTTTIYADKRRYPVLLSNGNCVARGIVDSYRHWAKWEDPFLKPCYLFALVAGDLVAIEDFFVTRSNRLVTLKIYVERDNQDKCQRAMEALKKAMQWDEEVYGREYDLDIYMIVAVNDFNMGAMENKGLNIFNSKYVLARPETATDVDYQHIDVVVGHEYFHNWSGNRVTCRDWFQLSLKEGLTVFREHHFSRDIFRSTVSLIDNVRNLRTYQFAEDAGPIAHPVRPDSYIEINNFYTATVYEKGAELIRMLKTLLGWKNFRAGMDLYFSKNDGKAVTTDDFIAALEEASGLDLEQFKLWYTQAGTPEIVVEEKYEENTKNYSITLKQSCLPTPGQPDKKPFVIPVAVGLLDKTGQEILSETQILILKESEQTFSFKNISEKPILSILREFSAPVKVHLNQREEDLAFLLAHDSDDFNRWDAGQKLTESLIWCLVENYEAKKPLQVPQKWLEAHHAILLEAKLDAALKAEILTLPSLNYLIEVKKPVNLEAIFAVRTFLKQKLAEFLKEDMVATYKAYASSERYQYTPDKVAARSLKNLCLAYLVIADPSLGIELGFEQWKQANNMTDALAVMQALINWQGTERQVILDEFYIKWQHDPLVLDKWFRLQAGSELPETLKVVKQLMEHTAFQMTNPNKVYSLIGAFVNGNVINFHESSGSGYTFLADVVGTLDGINPQVASRMARGFSNWKRFDSDRQDKIRVQLQRLLNQKGISKDVFEVVSKCLAADISA